MRVLLCTADAFHHADIEEASITVPDIVGLEHDGKDVVWPCDDGTYIAVGRRSH